MEKLLIVLNILMQKDVATNLYSLNEKINIDNISWYLNLNIIIKITSQKIYKNIYRQFMSKRLDILLVSF